MQAKPLKIPVSEEDLAMVFFALGFTQGVLSERKDENTYGLQKACWEAAQRLAKAKEDSL